MNDFSIGNVLSDTVARIRAGFGVHFLYALLPAALTAAFSYLTAHTTIANVGADPAARLAIFTSPLYWISLAVGVVGSAWTAAGLVGSMLERPPLGFAGMVSVSLQNSLKYIVLYVVWYVMLIIGMVFLIVPGLVVLTLFAVSVPALVDRGIGPIAALGESRRLTKGRRFAVFGALVVFVVILAVPSLLLFSIIGFDVTSMVRAQQANPAISFATSLILGPIYHVLVSAFLVALYAQLGGPSHSDILETFS